MAARSESQIGFIVSEPQTYNVLVHYHLMKNAGTTISEIFRREFAGAYAEVHGPDSGSMITSQELVAFIKDHPHVRAISSHHARFPTPSEERLQFAYCCFVRHPIDRLYSLYSFLRASGDSCGPGHLAQQLAAPAFFQELIERYPNYVLNVQTNYLAGSGLFLYPPDRDDLRIAVSAMKHCTLPGVVHRAGESLAVAEYFLHPLFPGIQLHSRPKNVSLNPEQSRSERLYTLRHELGAKLYRQLIKLNRFDLELMDRTEDEIDRRKRLVPSFATRLDDYRQRCTSQS